MNLFAPKVLAIGVSVILMAGCTSAPKSEDFWGSTGIDSLEAHIPESISDMSASADLVFIGRVISTSILDNYDPELAEEIVPVGVEFSVSEVVGGSSADVESVTLVRYNSNGYIEQFGLQSEFPSEDFLIYAKHSPVAGYYLPVSDLGILVERRNGITPVLDKVGEAFTEGAESFDDVAEGN